MNIIRKRRVDLGLSQAQLIAPVGTSRQGLSDIENGRCLPTPEMAAALRTRLGHQGVPDRSQVLSSRAIELIWVDLSIGKS